uniref:Uncharacterized protein n=1 Tax=Anguilla anguilla TaxID=7936 RepID=A0A0E9WSW7_ANGAN
MPSVRLAHKGYAGLEITLLMYGCLSPYRSYHKQFSTKIVEYMTRLKCWLTSRSQILVCWRSWTCSDINQF